MLPDKSAISGSSATNSGFSPEIDRCNGEETSSSSSVTTGGRMVSTVDGKNHLQDHIAPAAYAAKPLSEYKITFQQKAKAFFRDLKDHLLGDHIVGTGLKITAALSFATLGVGLVLSPVIMGTVAGVCTVRAINDARTRKTSQPDIALAKMVYAQHDKQQLEKHLSAFREQTADEIRALGASGFDVQGKPLNTQAQCQEQIGELDHQLAELEDSYAQLLQHHADTAHQLVAQSHNVNEKRADYLESLHTARGLLIDARDDESSFSGAFKMKNAFEFNRAAGTKKGQLERAKRQNQQLQSTNPEHSRLESLKDQWVQEQKAFIAKKKAIMWQKKGVQAVTFLLREQEKYHTLLTQAQQKIEAHQASYQSLTGAPDPEKLENMSLQDTYKMGLDENILRFQSIVPDLGAQTRSQRQMDKNHKELLAEYQQSLQERFRFGSPALIPTSTNITQLKTFLNKTPAASAHTLTDVQKRTLSQLHECNDNLYEQAIEIMKRQDVEVLFRGDATDTKTARQVFQERFATNLQQRQFIEEQLLLTVGLEDVSNIGDDLEYYIDELSDYQGELQKREANQAEHDALMAVRQRLKEKS